MMYQFLKPFVVEAHAFERTFGLSATPLREGMARTVAWYRAHAAELRLGLAQRAQPGTSHATGSASSARKPGRKR